MQPILDLALKDILQILRDRMSFLFLVFMPVVFTLLFGFAFGGSQQPRRHAPRGGLLDQDHSALERRAGRQPASFMPPLRLDAGAAADPAALDALVANGKLAAAVIVPAGFARRRPFARRPRAWR